MSKPTVSSDQKKSSDADIIKVLREHAGLNPEEGTDRAELLQLCVENDIIVDGKVDKKLSEVKNAKAGQKVPKQAVIYIAGSKDTRDVKCAVNGHTYIIPCDKDVTIPYHVLEVLNNARQSHLEQERNELGQVVNAFYRDVPTYNVSIKNFIY